MFWHVLGCSARQGTKVFRLNDPIEGLGNASAVLKSIFESMSRPLFILSREKERSLVDAATIDPVGRDLLYQMVDAVLTVKERERVTMLELAPIWQGFMSDDEAVWTRAGAWLAKLVDYSPELTSVVDELLIHQDDAVRSRICSALADKHIADSLVWPRLKRALSDRSEQVREMAIKVCIKRQNPRMLPPLEAAYLAEPDEKRRERLQMAISLIRGEAFWLSAP